VFIALSTAALVFYFCGSIKRNQSGRSPDFERVYKTIHCPYIEIKMPYGRIIYHPPLKELNEDVALLLGLHAGDGWLSDKWAISCGQNDKEMPLRIIELARNILGTETKRPIKCPQVRRL
jgi:hypothetical protein